MADSKIREWFKMMFIYKHICKGWSVRRRNANTFEFSKPSVENKTYYTDVNIN